MRLDLRFSNRPLEDIWCQALAAFVFQESGIRFSPLSELNEKFSGYLADLENRGLWTGEKGENLLLASQDMIKAEKLLIHGLGRREDFSISILENEAGELGATLDRIKVCDFGISVPVLGGLETEYPSYLESSAIQLVNQFFDNHKDDEDFYLKVIFSVGSEFVNILSSVENRLREHFTSIMDFSIIVDRNSLTRESEAFA